jgi:hypothetical protein
MKPILRLLALYLIMSGPVLAEKHEQTVLEYGAQCVREIGYIRPFDCNSGTNIPITINGKPPAENENPPQCDRPSLLYPTTDVPGQCAPYSKILNLSHGNTQISAYCKRNTWRQDKSAYYDEVNIVAKPAGFSQGRLAKTASTLHACLRRTRKCLRAANAQRSNSGRRQARSLKSPIA